MNGIAQEARVWGMKVWWLMSLMTLAAALPAEASQCTLAWNANAEPNVAGYRVYHAYSSNGYIHGSFNFTTDATSLTCEEMGIGYDGRLHYWTVTAYNTSGESPFASEVWMQMPQITAPAPPPAVSPPAPICLRFAGRSSNCKEWDTP